MCVIDNDNIRQVNRVLCTLLSRGTVPPYCDHVTPMWGHITIWGIHILTQTHCHHYAHIRLCTPTIALCYKISVCVCVYVCVCVCVSGPSVQITIQWHVISLLYYVYKHAHSSVFS